MKFCRYIAVIVMLWLSVVNALTPLSLYQDTTAELDNAPVASFSRLSASDGGEKFFITSAQPGAGDFSIAVGTRFSPQVIPVMPNKIILNGKKEQDNPLHNNGVVAMTMLTNESMAVVSTAYPNQVAHLERVMYPSGRSIVMSDPLLDANGQPCSAIKKVAPITGKMILAIVNPHNNAFGAAGTGLALVCANTIKVLVEQEVQPGEEPKEPKEENKELFSQINTSSDQEVVKAVPFDVSIKPMAYNYPLASINDHVVMHWDQLLGTMFIGISGQAAAHNDAGICGVMAFNVLEKNILLKSVLSPELLSDRQDEIIGGKGAGAQVTIHTLKTLHTEMPQPDRMGLSYLIVHGGNGDAQSTRKTIYALPLVNRIDSQEVMTSENQPAHALVAVPFDMPVKHNQIPPRKPFVLKLSHNNCAVNNAQLFTTERTEKNIPAHVGAGPVPYGDVTNIFVIHDAVYAVVGKADEGHLPCVCFSQPIYDSLGRVVAWTQWQPVITTNDEIIDAGLDATAYQLYVITNNNEKIVVNKTKWESSQDKDNRVTTLVSELFPQGIQLLQDYSTHGYMLAAGRKKVAFIPQTMIDNQIGITDNQAMPLVCEQGALMHIECPTTAATVTIDSQNYLCIGGVGGVAVAASNNPLVDQLSFVSLGSYKYVRKLIAMNDCLYVLTDKTIERIDMRASDIENNRLSVTTIVDASSQLGSKYATISDMIVSGKLLLVASSMGLYRNNDHTDVELCSSLIGLQKIEIPEDATAISHLYHVSVSGKSTDVSNHNGMVYVITGSRGKNRARLHRLAISDTVNNAVSSTTAQLIQDCIINDIRSEFRNLGAYYDHVFAQGALFINVRNKDATQATVVNRGFRQGSYSLFTGIDEKASVHAITRNAARGNLLIAGDFGLQMQ